MMDVAMVLVSLRSVSYVVKDTSDSAAGAILTGFSRSLGLLSEWMHHGLVCVSIVDRGRRY